MRFYAIDSDGNILAESESRTKLVDYLLPDLGYDMTNNWLCRMWTNATPDGWTSSLSRHATEAEARTEAEVFESLAGYDTEREAEVFQDIEIVESR